MNFMDMANLLDSDGNMQNEMMVMAFAATLLSTIPVLLGTYMRFGDFFFKISLTFLLYLSSSLQAMNSTSMWG